MGFGDTELAYDDASPEPLTFAALGAEDGARLTVSWTEPRYPVTWAGVVAHERAQHGVRLSPAVANGEMLTEEDITVPSLCY